MIPSRLTEIDEGALQRLVALGIAESLSLEYKVSFPRTESFVESVCALANTNGGDLVLGIREEAGRAAEVLGLEVPDLDKELQRISDVIMHNTDPQLRGFRVRPVVLNSGRTALVIRVEQSWHRPHMCSLTFKFPARSLAGKHPMDTANIRQTMLLSAGVSGRMREFVLERRRRIEDGTTRVPLQQGIVLCLHILPLSAYATESLISPNDVNQHGPSFGPLQSDGFTHDFNADGILFFPGGANPVRAYTQVFRTGEIEATHVFSHMDEAGREFLFAWPFYERLVMDGCAKFIDGQRRIGIGLPVFAVISIVAPPNSVIPSDVLAMLENHRAKDSVVTSPACQITSDDLDDLGVPLRIAFDMVANAWGQPGSPSYRSGKWQARR